MPWPTTRVLWKAEHFNYPISIPELHRVRLDRWRTVYAVAEEEDAVDVLAVPDAHRMTTETWKS